jgi:hypothetical protein
MDDDLDRLLTVPLALPPEDFVATVMGQIARAPVPASASRMTTVLQWIALLGVGVPAAAELASLVLSMWTVSSAG